MLRRRLVGGICGGALAGAALWSARTDRHSCASISRRLSYLSRLSAGERPADFTDDTLACAREARQLARGIASSAFGTWLASAASVVSDMFPAFLHPRHALAATPLDALVGDKTTVMDNYENRIREMSAPEKVFGYFASVVRDGESYMTVADFLRSITPFWSADRSDQALLALDKFRYLKMADIDGDGLINFDEYIVFITLLSIPVRDFEIAFNMFDLDRNGTLDINEFRRVLKIMRDKNPYGRAQLTSNVENSGLIAHFFGADGNGELRMSEFSGFLHGLRTEILQAEFEHVARGRESITGTEFGRFAVSYTRTRYLSKLNRRLSRAPIPGEVSFEDFRNFHRLLERMDQLEAAMHLMLKKGEGFSRDDFSRAAEVVVGVPQSPVVVEVIYRIFDDNDDDHLSPEEFVSVMRYTSTLGLQKPRDTGITRAFGCALQCFRDEL